MQALVHCVSQISAITVACAEPERLGLKRFPVAAKYDDIVQFNPHEAVFGPRVVVDKPVPEVVPMEAFGQDCGTYFPRIVPLRTAHSG
ncbi:unnamed protein product [Macrosiphum euphorbiae]|uniref:Uncharacterized protein n=1 Tax=Macrosiphum euphorbiae TaxID=13131 RepID=A0AAV0VH87_9HEMI|nr:unnamed protein product [Macrosiphum euphorbiae]